MYLAFIFQHLEFKSVPNGKIEIFQLSHILWYHILWYSTKVLLMCLYTCGYKAVPGSKYNIKTNKMSYYFFKRMGLFQNYENWQDWSLHPESLGVGAGAVMAVVRYFILIAYLGQPFVHRVRKVNMFVAVMIIKWLNWLWEGSIFS